MSRRALLALLVVLPGCGTEPPPETALSIARAVHTATALPGAQVLIAGGCVTDGCGTATETTELYDARSGRFTPAPRLTGPRDGHTATPLPGGEVLLTGGYAGTDATTDIYYGGSFRRGPRMRHARAGHTATALADGRVLVAGGYGPEGRAVAGAELFDGRRFVPAGRLDTARGKHAAVLLPDKRVLLIGGSADEETRSRLASTELYDPRTGRFSPGPTLTIARYKLPAAAALLRDGRVLVAGDGAAPEILDVGRNRSVEVPGRAAGAFATATPLGGGRTLVTGGYDDQIAVSDAAFVIVDRSPRPSRTRPRAAA